MMSRVYRQVVTVAAFFLAIGTAASCDKVALVAPTDAVITISTNRTVLPLNGTAEIRASVVELSGPSVHNGTLVTFTTDLGRLEPQDARTNNGQAVVTLHAGTESGTATVRAFSGGAQSVGDGGLALIIGAAAAETMTVTATPAELPSTGGSSNISATVIDSSVIATRGLLDDWWQFERVRGGDRLCRHRTQHADHHGRRHGYRGDLAGRRHPNRWDRQRSHLNRSHHHHRRPGGCYGGIGGHLYGDDQRCRW